MADEGFALRGSSPKGGDGLAPRFLFYALLLTVTGAISPLRHRRALPYRCPDGDHGTLCNDEMKRLSDITSYIQMLGGRSPYGAIYS